MTPPHPGLLTILVSGQHESVIEYDGKVRHIRERGMDAGAEQYRRSAFNSCLSTTRMLPLNGTDL